MFVCTSICALNYCLFTYLFCLTVIHLLCYYVHMRLSHILLNKYCYLNSCTHKVTNMNEKCNFAPCVVSISGKQGLHKRQYIFCHLFSSASLYWFRRLNLPLTNQLARYSHVRAVVQKVSYLVRLVLDVQRSDPCWFCLLYTSPSPRD